MQTSRSSNVVKKLKRSNLSSLIGISALSCFILHIVFGNISPSNELHIKRGIDNTGLVEKRLNVEIILLKESVLKT